MPRTTTICQKSESGAVLCVWGVEFSNGLQSKKASTFPGLSRAAAVEDIPEPPTVFTITPDKITLQPGTAMRFTLQAKYKTAGLIDQKWICK